MNKKILIGVAIAAAIVALPLGIMKYNSAAEEAKQEQLAKNPFYARLMAERAQLQKNVDTIKADIEKLGMTEQRKARLESQERMLRIKDNTIQSVVEKIEKE